MKYSDTYALLGPRDPQVYRTERYTDLVAKVRRLQSKIKDEDASRKPGEKVRGVTYQIRRKDPGISSHNVHCVLILV